MVDGATHSDSLAACYEAEAYEAEARPSFDFPKLIVWLSATAASWIVVIALWKLAATLIP